MKNTKMMKRYEAETGKQALTYIMVHVSVDGYDYGELVPSEEYNNWLEAQLRWRPVSEELPSVEKDGAAILAIHKDVDKGRVPFDCVPTIWFLNNYKIWFTHWLPIPPAPEGDLYGS